MTYLYSVKEHPTTLLPLIRVWEIVHSTNTFYDVQPRNIPNEIVMTVTRRISKAQVEHRLAWRNEYHFSPQAAMDALIKRNKSLISDANAIIVAAQENILSATEHLPAQIAELEDALK